MEYDVVVIGAGHAGCEAALACARMGQRTLLLTLNIESVAMLACNPSIGGTAKGHLVREVDALGGEMGLAIDEVFIQSRMINTGKGPAVHSLRAQADKHAYHLRMLRAVRSQPNLTLRQGEASRLVVSGGRITGVVTDTGASIACRAVVLAAGVYSRSRVMIGQRARDMGPSGFANAPYLAESLEELGFALRRFKTGTPARIDGRTVDFAKLDEQPGDVEIRPFSFLSDAALLQREQVSCYLGYTNEETHRIVRENVHLAPTYSGLTDGVGARYCPSIEDKVMRFPDRERHPFFLEPEGLNTVEWYVQGVSTGLPEEVQLPLYRSLPGLKDVEIVRLAYAIEYDVIDSLALRNTLCARDIEGLYFAGQINGTSGYEEAAAQGLYAGVNAALWLKGKEPMTLGRDQAYIGVLVDDLTTKGTNEPYRMMTSRAEYRLLIRQDNADLRLTEIGCVVGLAGEERRTRVRAKQRDIEDAMAAIQARQEVMKRMRQGMTYAQMKMAGEDLPDIGEESQEQVDLSIKYQGYIQRQLEHVAKFRRMEDVKLPMDLEYEGIAALRIEAREKLARLRPATLGAASRIPGVSPGDISVLMVLLKARGRME